MFVNVIEIHELNAESLKPFIIISGQTSFNIEA